VRSIRKWAIKKGINVDKPLEPMDIKIEEIKVDWSYYFLNFIL